MSDFKYPKAHVVSAVFRPSNEYGDYRVVTVECPLCPKRHNHGADLGKRGSLGHKAPHCESKYRASNGNNPSGYVVWDETPIRSYER
ncbi:hypothetical protein [Nocardioides nanhaiensis]|uniref:Uncharacterized protein n=1 Tax=Nocardioides nanhaiensis TaxID=1476871 RepID=A0ABP8X3Y7_9ACTN